MLDWTVGWVGFGRPLMITVLNYSCTLNITCLAFFPNIHLFTGVSLTESANRMNFTNEYFHKYSIHRLYIFIPSGMSMLCL